MHDNPNTISGKHNRITLCARDLRILKGECLNDSIVNFYAQYIVKENMHLQYFLLMTTYSVFLYYLDNQIVPIDSI